MELVEGRLGRGFLRARGRCRRRHHLGRGRGLGARRTTRGRRLLGATTARRLAGRRSRHCRGRRRRRGLGLLRGRRTGGVEFDGGVGALDGRGVDEVYVGFGIIGVCALGLGLGLRGGRDEGDVAVRPQDAVLRDHRVARLRGRGWLLAWCALRIYPCNRVVCCDVKHFHRILSDYYCHVHIRVRSISKSFNK